MPGTGWLKKERVSLLLVTVTSCKGGKPSLSLSLSLRCWKFDRLNEQTIVLIFFFLFPFILFFSFLFFLHPSSLFFAQGRMASRLMRKQQARWIYFNGRHFPTSDEGKQPGRKVDVDQSTTEKFNLLPLHSFFFFLTRRKGISAKALPIY